MKSTCTRVVGGPWPVTSSPPGPRFSTARARPRRAAQRHPRGVAEVELILIIPILLTILMMTWGAYQVQFARIHNAYDAENDVYTQVVAGRDFTISSNPTPPTGVDVPLLPDRYAIASPTRTGSIIPGLAGATHTYSDQAIMQDAAWHYSAWPQTADRAVLQEWFTDYVDESHPPDVVQALGLQPPGPP